MNAIIAFALRLRALMVALFVLVMIGGVTAFVRLNIEAYPDPVPPLVDIVTQNPGQSAEEIERYITIPIEVPVATAPYLTAMRIISLFGLSDVKLQFTYDLTYEEAELCEASGVTRGGFYAHRYALVPLVTAMPPDATGLRAPYWLLQRHSPCIQSGCVNMLKPISPRIMSTTTAVMIHITRISDFSVFRSSGPVIDSSFFNYHRSHGKRLQLRHKTKRLMAVPVLSGAKGSRRLPMGRNASSCLILDRHRMTFCAGFLTPA